MQITLSRWIKLLQKVHILQNVPIKYLPWNARTGRSPRELVPGCASYDFALRYQAPVAPRAMDALMKIRAHLRGVLAGAN